MAAGTAAASLHPPCHLQTLRSGTAMLATSSAMTANMKPLNSTESPADTGSLARRCASA
jgi:hypothetical protein